jgi:16S rRNA (cytosine967-C5)-methyltransferase
MQPCSGFRRFKKKSDAKWKLKPEFIDNMRKYREVLVILENCKTRRKWFMLLCSILPSENQDQIAKFLATDIGKEFNCQDQKNSGFRIWF